VLEVSMLATQVHLHHALNEGLLHESASANVARSAIRHGGTRPRARRRVIALGGKFVVGAVNAAHATRVRRWLAFR